MIAFRTPYWDSSFSFYHKESLILIIIRYEKIQVPKDTFFVIILRVFLNCIVLTKSCCHVMLPASVYYHHRRSWVRLSKDIFFRPDVI